MATHIDRKTRRSQTDTKITSLCKLAERKLRRGHSEERGQSMELRTDHRQEKRNEILDTHAWKEVDKADG